MNILNSWGLKTKLFFLVGGILFVITNVIAQEGTSGIPKIQREIFDLQKFLRQITTHPEMDMSVVLSPDGKWLAFTSRRSGNLDIWVKPVKGGRSIPNIYFNLPARSNDCNILSSARGSLPKKYLDVR